MAATLTLPATVVTRLASPPVPPTDIGDAKVIVILGLDAANTSSTTSSTAPGATSTTSTTRRP